MESLRPFEGAGAVFELTSSSSSSLPLVLLLSPSVLLPESPPALLLPVLQSASSLLPSPSSSSPPPLGKATFCRCSRFAFLFFFIDLSHSRVEQVELRRDGVRFRRVFLGLLGALGVLQAYLS